MAISIIDAFVVTFGLDPANYAKGRKQVEAENKKLGENSRKTAKNMEADTKQATQAFSSLRSEILSLLALFTAGKGFEAFIKDIGFADAATGRLAKTMDTSTEELARWQQAAELSGGSADGMTSSLQNLVSQFQSFQMTGESSLIPYLRALQVNFADASGKMRPFTEIMLDLADKFQSMDPAKAAAFGRAMGFDQGTINLLIQGRKAVQGYLNEAEKIGHANRQSAATGADLQRRWNGIKQTWEQTARVLLIQLQPALDKILESVRAFGAWAQEHPAIITAAFWALTAAVLALSAAMAINFGVSAVGAMTGGLGLILVGVRALLLNMAVLTAVALPALSEAFLALGAAIELTPIGWILTGIAALSVAGYELYEHWDEVKAWWRGLWDDMADIPNLAVERAKQAQDKSVWDVILSSVGIGGVKRPGTAGAAAPSAPPSAGGDSTLPTEDNVQSMLRNMVPGVTITGGARTPERNAAVGGVANSMHLRGQAVDFKLPSNVSFSQFKAALDASGFRYTELLNEGQIGGQGAHIHLGWGQKGGGSAHKLLSGSGFKPPSVGTSLSDAARMFSTGGSTSTSSATNNIGQVNINTRATDADGIARDIHGAIVKHSLATQANSGLS